MSIKETEEVTLLIDRLPTHIKEITKKMRQLIFLAAPDITEEIKWSKPSYSQNGLVCYLAPAKNHVNLGFYQGSELNDPEGLLKGTGEQMRHIQVKEIQNIKPDSFITLIHNAVELNN